MKSILILEKGNSLCRITYKDLKKLANDREIFEILETHIWDQIDLYRKLLQKNPRSEKKLKKLLGFHLH